MGASLVLLPFNPKHARAGRPCHARTYTDFPMGNWNFSGDEWLFFLAALSVASFGVATRYARLLRPRPLGDTRAIRMALALVVPVAASGIYVVLQNWADPLTVAGHSDYVLLFLAGGILWMVLAEMTLGWLGVSARDDAVDRANPAAACAVCGALLGVAALYAYANVGAGPTIWTTLFPAAVATATFFALWVAIELSTGVAEAIAVDRDVASGIRTGAWALATGLVLGRAMAGDWTSWGDTFADYARLGWPALGLAAVAIVAQRLFRPTPSHPVPQRTTAGVLPAALMLIAAVVYVASLGAPLIGKHVITYEQDMEGR